MKKDEATPYLIKAYFILKGNFSPLLMLLVVSVIVPLIQKEPNFASLLFGNLVMLLLYPVVYGQYTEIVLRHRRVNYPILFRRHFLNFFLISILLWLPLIFIVFIGLTLKSNVGFLMLLYSIVISSLSIYVFPLVFITGKKLKSIEIGFKCVLGNLQFNLPLMMIVSAATVLPYLVSFPHTGDGKSFNVVALAFLTIISLVVEFWMFVAAILILKDKGLVGE